MPAMGTPVTVVASGGAPVTPVGLEASQVAVDGGGSVQDALDGLDARAPTSLFRSAIPFVYPSSGTMGNNGALSGITALPQQLAVAYFWMPANAISAGSAAGWYYGEMSSTTAATLYNNTYTTGVPATPPVATPFVTTGPGAYTQEVAAGKAGPTYVMPGGTMGPLGKLRLEAVLRIAIVATNKTFQVRANASNLTGTAVLNNNGNGVVLGHVRAQESVARQAVDFVNLAGAVAAQSPPANRTFNTAADVTLDAFLTLTAATEWMVLMDFEIIQEA